MYTQCSSENTLLPQEPNLINQLVSPPKCGQNIASVFLALSAKIIYTSILCMETAL